MKFKKGDKVMFVRDCGFSTARHKLLGEVFTIEDMHIGAYKVRETDYYFNDCELELVEKNEKIRIVIDPRDSAGAHKAVDEAIAKYRKKYFDWTEEELKQARELFKELAAEWVLDRNDILVFKNNLHEERITLETYAMCDILVMPRGNDVFNPLIGKVVCLCKALNKPIPDFINNKNR